MLTMKMHLGCVVLAFFAANVYGHGGMTKPEIRPITAKYRSECYFGLKGAGDEELQIAPLELLSTRIQADQPSNPAFDMMNGCRGTVYEPGNPVTEVTPGQNVPIEYKIAAPHPGYLEMGIVKSETAGGKIMYKRVTVLSRTENFATSSASTPLSVSIPSNVAGCSNPGDCALQFYWHSDIAKQTYVTCADIVVKGSGGSPPAAPTPAGPSPAGPSPDSPTPATPTGPSPATPAAPTGPSPAGPSPAAPSPEVYPANTPPNTPPTAPTPNTPGAPTPNTPGAPTPNTPAAPTPNTPAAPSPRKKCAPRRK